MKSTTIRTAPAALLLGLAFATSTLAAVAAPALAAAATTPGAKPAPAIAASVAQLHYPPLPELAIPQPERVVLDNGMVVMLLEDHELPLVDATALVRTGTRLDPADRVGLAQLTSTVLRTGGTERMSGDQLDDYLEGKAATLESSISKDSGRITLSCLKDDFPEVLRVFADVLRRPAFAEDKLAVAKNQQRANVARQNDSAQGILFREFNKLIYGPDSPYSYRASFASLAKIGRDDLVAFYRAQFHPENIVLGVVGDFDRAAVLAEIKTAFGDWPRGSAAGATAAKPGALSTVPYQQQTKPGIFYVEKDDVNQSNILMGNLGIVRNNPDYYALEVMNTVLSGGFASRLFADVRTKKGLAYYVTGDVGSDWDYPGTTNFYVSTKTETTGAALQALLDQARGMTAEPPTPEEVAKAKQAILSSFVFTIDSPRRTLGQILYFELHGYPLDWLSRYRQGIDAVTVEQVRAAAAKYLHPERFAILVVGPKEGTDKPLSTWGPVTNLDVAIHPEPKGTTP